MKPTVVVLAILVFASSTRESAAQTIDWGIVGGTAISHVIISGPQAFDANPNAGGGVGLFVGNSRDRAFGIHSEALLTWRRFSSDLPVGPLRASARALEVPVLLRARVASVRGTGVWVDAGPQFARIFSVKQRVGSLRTDMSNQLEHVDAAAVIGGAVGRNVGAHTVMFSARVVLGLRDLDPLPSQSLKPRAVLLLGSYGF